MFSDKSGESVSFDSQLASAKPEQPANVQTTDIVYHESGVQAVTTKSVETQTFVKQPKQPLYDQDKLASFLKRITPSVLEALDEVQGTSAYDEYEPETKEDVHVKPQLLHKTNTVDETNSMQKISNLSWSTTGGTLAVSYEVPQHEIWCDHLSKIQLFDHTKEGSFIDTPNRILETDACITTLSFHPDEPSIIAAGLFSGDVFVWNLRDSGSITPTPVCVHNDSVSQLMWKTGSTNDGSLLVSSSRDGYVFIHELLANFTTIHLSKRLKIAKEHNPAENSRPRSAGGRRERAVESGLCITTFDFSPKDLIFFIAGTLCGGVYKCSIDRLVPIEGDGTLLDPVIDEYERHSASITCVKFSPIRNLFVTAATDKEIRIYDFNQHTCLRSIPLEHTVIGIRWLIGNQDVFAAYGASSNIEFYNVTDGKSLTNAKLETVERGNVCSICVNPKRDLLTIADTHGNVEIWRVPRQLF